MLPSDTHDFVGRIFDLSIVGMHFESYDELAKHADCKYAFDVNYRLTMLTQRVESLNLVGRMLWPKSTPETFNEFPVSRYEWLTLSADVFLMRYISVVDCALLLTNEVFETAIDPRNCSLQNLKKRGVQMDVYKVLEGLLADQGQLREERNLRFHRGEERSFSTDDATFKLASLFEHRASGVRGTDRHGRDIDVSRYFKESSVELQREFNRVSRRLIRGLNRLYDHLAPEFESRFSPRFRVGPFGPDSRKPGC